MVLVNDCRSDVSPVNNSDSDNFDNDFQLEIEETSFDSNGHYPILFQSTDTK